MLFSFFLMFFKFPLLIENIKLSLTLVIPTGAPIIIATEAIETPPSIADKANSQSYQNNKTLQYIY